MWVKSDCGSLLLWENKGPQFELPFEAILGGEDWLASVERIQRQFLGRSFPAGLWGLSYSTHQLTKEDWAFVVFKVQLVEPVQLVRGVWKNSLEGLKLGPMISQVREMIDTPQSPH